MVVWLDPADSNTQLFSSYIQDEIAVVPEHLALTVGTMLEHNYYTGFGLMPSARAVWNVTGLQMMWAAVSRAIRTPAITDALLQITAAAFYGFGGIPTFIRTVGNPDLANEALTPYEAGYRTQALSRVFLDFAAYYNAYDHLVTSEPAAPFIETSPSRPHMLIPLVNSNLMKGEAHGLEVYADWKLTDHWLLRPGYALEELHLHLDPASEDTRSVPRIEGSVPRHWARLESHARLYRNLQWDASTAFTDRLPFQGIASWTRIDTQLSIPLAERASFSVVGQDLLRDRHLEFIDPVGGSTPSMSRRSIFGVVTWRF